MNKLLKRGLLITTAFVIAGLPQSIAGAVEANGSAAMVSVVRSFYTFHLRNNKAFTVKNVQLRKRWFTPEFYQVLLGELKREAAESKAHPDEAPYIEGDPFTESQEYPHAFQTGTPAIEGDSGKVPITLTWKWTGFKPRKLEIRLKNTGGRWLIDDIVNGEGTSLKEDLLKQKQQ